MSRAGVMAIVGVVVVMAAAFVYSFTSDRTTVSRQVWDPDHGHYHTVP